MVGSHKIPVLHQMLITVCMDVACSWMMMGFSQLQERIGVKE